jgi:hypothetical protein
MSGAIPPLPNTPSWCWCSVKKGTGITLPFTFGLVPKAPGKHFVTSLLLFPYIEEFVTLRTSSEPLEISKDEHKVKKQQWRDRDHFAL